MLGHGNCGAVKAAIEGKAVPGQISALYATLRPGGGSKRARTSTPPSTPMPRYQARLLSKASPVIAGAIKEGRLKVVPPDTISRAERSRC